MTPRNDLLGSAFSLGAVAILLSLAAGATAKQALTIFISKPTLIAFFSASKSELKNADTNEALADFQFYVGSVRDLLNKKGVDVKEVYVPSWRIRRGTKVTSFHPAKDVGYYFATPGKEPRIEYGVLTDRDLLEIADDYFRDAAK